MMGASPTTTTTSTGLGLGSLGLRFASRFVGVPIAVTAAAISLVAPIFLGGLPLAIDLLDPQLELCLGEEGVVEPDE